MPSFSSCVHLFNGQNYRPPNPQHPGGPTVVSVDFTIAECDLYLYSDPGFDIFAVVIGFPVLTILAPETFGECVSGVNVFLRPDKN
jgi:hypothetical protein